MVSPASLTSTLTGPNNRTTEVYEQLRRAIVEGVIRPNERLIESDLAERFKVSRTPIRESMMRLAADGLIISQRRGWAVREHSPTEIREVYEVRAGLEGFAAGLAAERATEEEMKAIQAIHQSYSDSVRESSRGHIVAHNDEFHEAVLSAAHNHLLTERVHANSQYYFIHRLAGFLSDEEVRSSLDGHGELVKALVARDRALAEKVARANVFEGLVKVLTKIR